MIECLVDIMCNLIVVKNRKIYKSLNLTNFMDIHKKIVKSVDSELEYVEVLGYINRPVYHVRKNNIDYILKAFDYNRSWERRHIDIEKEVLEMSKDVEGITHLVKDYGVIKNEHIAILKEYAEGETLSKFGKIINREVKEQLISAISELHYIGIANLDINDSNVVVSKDKNSAKIIDLGYCKFKRNLTAHQFDVYRTTDFEDLKSIFE